MNFKEFLLAPLESLYSIEFYRKIRTLSVKRVIPYFFYLSLLLILMVSSVTSKKWDAQFDEFTHWLVQEMPEIEVTPSGLRVLDPLPFNMVHPTLGLFATFVEDDKNIQPQNNQLPLFIVSPKTIYLKSASGSYQARTLDWSRLLGEESNSARLDGSAILRMMDNIRDLWSRFVMIALFLGAPILFAISALLMAWWGYMTIHRLKFKIPFSQVYLLSSFSLTSGFLFLVVHIFLPFKTSVFTTWFFFLICGIHLNFILSHLEPKKEVDNEEEEDYGF